MYGKSLISSGALVAVVCAVGCYSAGDVEPLAGDTEADGSSGGMQDDGGPGTTPSADDGDDGTPGGDDGTPGDDDGTPSDDDGTPGDDTGEPMDDTGGDDSTGEPVDLESPTIVSVSPGDAELGVMPDVPIVVTFSEPMDEVATEAAYQSQDIPAAAVTFSWNDAGDELTITPNEPLEWGQGEDPAEVEALSYAYAITTAATDLAGNELEAEHAVEFSTIRQVLQALPALGAWTGRIRSDGPVAFDYIMVGDTSDDDQYKGFISFEISGLPNGITQFQAAEMRLHNFYTQGDPYVDLDGDLVAYDIEFTSMDLVTFGAAPLAEAGVLSDVEGAGWRALDVTPFVADDYAADHDATQFRLEFPSATDGNDDPDTVFLQSTLTNPAVLYILYLLP